MSAVDATVTDGVLDVGLRRWRRGARESPRRHRGRRARERGLYAAEATLGGSVTPLFS